MTDRPAIAETIDQTAAAARSAVAFARPRLRGLLHALSFPISLIAGIWAVVHTTGDHQRLSVGIYAFTLSACLGASALYHRGRWSPQVRSVLRRIDHAAIFLLIAGTFTPVAVLALSGWWTVTTLVVVWGAAAIGIFVNSAWHEAPDSVEVLPYLAVGAFGFVLLPQLLIDLGAAGAALLGLGGILYLVGAAVYASHRPDPWPRTFGFHEVFHSLVVAAAVVHWIAITHWVVPTH